LDPASQRGHRRARGAGGPLETLLAPAAQAAATLPEGFSEEVVWSGHDFWDRGLLGMAIDPQFPTRPYVYVLYTYDHVLGSSNPPPRWGDGCPNPPRATDQGCVVSGRLSRLTADTTSKRMVPGSERVLIEDWCQQFPSHSIGDLAFGPDGALYVSAGDGGQLQLRRPRPDRQSLW